jgi:hypothetical protein
MGFKMILPEKALTLSEEVSIAVNQLAAHRCRCQFSECVPLIARICIDSDFTNLRYSHRARSSQTFDNNLTAHSLLYRLFDLFEDFAS